jgi:hypothetical protein
MFGYALNCAFNNLNMTRCTLSISTPANTSAGILVGDVASGTSFFSDIVLFSSTVYVVNDTATANNIAVGGIVGRCFGTTTFSQVAVQDCNLTARTSSVNTVRGPHSVGGILGGSGGKTTFSGCAVLGGNIWGGHGASDGEGGLVGHHGGEGWGLTLTGSLVIRNCLVTVKITCEIQGRGFTGGGIAGCCYSSATYPIELTNVLFTGSINVLPGGENWGGGYLIGSYYQSGSPNYTVKATNALFAGEYNVPNIPGSSTPECIVSGNTKTEVNVKVIIDPATAFDEFGKNGQDGSGWTPGSTTPGGSTTLPVPKIPGLNLPAATPLALRGGAYEIHSAADLNAMGRRGFTTSKTSAEY